MKIELPALYSRSLRGEILIWRVEAVNDLVVIEHGVLGGKMIKNQVRCSPTNIGRSNARTPAEQAQFEASSAWDKKKKGAYFPTIEEATRFEILLPMLAHPLTKKSKGKETRRSLRFPCDIQRKLNGLRCMAQVGVNKTVTLWSREGTMWDSLWHIEKDVATIGDPGDVFDGEVYLHGTPLQVLNSWIKNKSDPLVAEKRLALQYHVYDMPRGNIRTGMWEDRHAALSERFRVLPGFDCSLKLVETTRVNTEVELAMFAQGFVAEGYEGAIIRQLGHEYTFGKRREALLKYKEFKDEEFEVLDALCRELIDATGSHVILDKFVCRASPGKTFEVVPRGTMLARATMWEEREKYFGELLTVRYLEKSVDGIPQGNPVGLHFRLLEDLPPPEEEESMWT